MIDLKKKCREYVPDDTLNADIRKMNENIKEESLFFAQPQTDRQSKDKSFGNRKSESRFNSIFSSFKNSAGVEQSSSEDAELKKKELLIKLGFIWLVGLIVGMYIFQPIMSFVTPEAETTYNPFMLIFNYIVYNPTFLLLICFVDVIIVLATMKLLRDKKEEKRDIKFDLAENTTFGSAHVATKEELEGVLYFEEKKDPKGFVLGLSRDTKEAVTSPYGIKDADGKSYNTKRNGNTMVFGASGSGKTFCFVKPNVLTRIANKQSYVVTDPSGELYRDTSKLAKDNGYNVKVLNLLDFAASDGWNPFACIDRTDPNSLTDLTTLCGSIMKNTSDAKNSGDYFYNNEENLLKCLSFYTALSEEFKGEEYERNLATVYDMIVQIAAQGNEFSELDALVADHPQDPAASPWALFSSESDNIKKNFVSGLNSRLNKFENPNFKEIFRHNDIDMSRAGKEPCAYYVIFDEKNDTYKFVLNMFFSSFITILFNEAKNNPNKTGKLDIPVFFILDEAASIGQLPDFIKVLNNVRKYGITFAYITQSFGFLQSVFGTRDEAIAAWSACDNTLVVGVNDSDTALEIQKKMGEATARVEDEKRSQAAYFTQPAGGMHQVGIKESQRPLMTIGEILTEESAIILPRNRNAYIADKYAFLNHKFADFTEESRNKELAKEHIPKWINETNRRYHYGLAAMKENQENKNNEKYNNNNNNNYENQEPIRR